MYLRGLKNTILKSLITKVFQPVIILKLKGDGWEHDNIHDSIQERPDDEHLF